MNTIRLSSGQSSLFWIGLAAFALTILFVNPLRETAVYDDWSYALPVEHLLKTGSYQPHDWVEASMPFQAYWGGLFARVFGYSFTSLRTSTLALAFLGLIAFYYLAREHRLNAIQAGLIMLALCASPLVFRLSFSFNTDVPFLMCFIIAVFLYTRAIRLESYPLLFLASIAASAAILTRQFGVALPAGIFSVWALSKERRDKALFYLIGLILPVVATLWQLSTGILTPTWMQRYELHRQSIDFANIEMMLSNILWRPTVILQYLALFSLPFVLLALLAFALELRQRRSIIKVLPLGLCAFYILGGVIYGRFANDRPWFLPYIPWEDTLSNMSRWQQAILTLVTSAGATFYAYILALRYSTNHGWGSIPPSERLLDLCTLFLLAEHLIFRAFGDRYLLGFLPFVLIVVGHYLGSWLNRWKMAMAILCLGMLVTSAVWTRGLMAEAEAKWKAAESIRAAGVEPRHIYGSPEWNFYHGATDDYMAEIRDSTKLDSKKEDFWRRWYPQRQKQSQFLLVGSARPPVNEKWELVKEVPYMDTLFRLKHVYVVKRGSTSQ